MHADPSEFLPVEVDRVVVLGRYVGEAPDGGSAVAAAFAHAIIVRGSRLAAFQEITDTAKWLRFRARERDEPHSDEPYELYDRPPRLQQVLKVVPAHHVTLPRLRATDADEAC